MKMNVELTDRVGTDNVPETHTSKVCKVITDKGTYMVEIVSKKGTSWVKEVDKLYEYAKENCPGLDHDPVNDRFSYSNGCLDLTR